MVGRRPSHIPTRKAFPVSVKRAVMERSGGCCEKAGCPNAGVEYDHVVPVALGGKSDELNCTLLCRDCHQKKTALDVKMIAKADRAGGRSGQWKRRMKAKAKGTYRPIPNRGFQKPPAGHSWWGKRKRK